MQELSPQQITQFIEEGFVKIENAFPTVLANECRAMLWKEIGLDPNDPKLWTKPVIRVADMSARPFDLSANTPILLRAYEQLAGKNWLPRHTIGSFPIRFPVPRPAGDTGWHVDSSFPGEDPFDYLQWRVNIYSKGRALLMLFLYSDVGDNDAPTKLRIGSHLDVAKILKPAGEDGLSFMELAQQLHISRERKEAIATGKAGTVYLCHPFIVHAAQEHRGVSPKFMAQPPLLARQEFKLKRDDKTYCPVETAILKAIGEA
jgi:hypothetical protein